MKTPIKAFTGLGLVIVSLILAITSCQKDVSQSGDSTRQLKVYLTDDPCIYDSVFVDIRQGEVKIDTTRRGGPGDEHDIDDDDDHTHHDQYGKWDTLNITPGVYNIMHLRNGVDTLLASGTIPAGSVRKIRLTLGTNNSVVIAGTHYPLNLYPGAHSYVYVKISDDDMDDMGQGHAQLWVDFDICQSIQQHNGLYYLRPVIKPFSMGQFGRIEGKVLPRAAHPFVKAYNALDSATAIPEEDDGEYKIRGLKEGTYSVLFKGSNGYHDTTINNVQVQRARETHINTVTLRQ